MKPSSSDVHGICSVSVDRSEEPRRCPFEVKSSSSLIKVVGDGTAFPMVAAFMKCVSNLLKLAAQMAGPLIVMFALSMLRSPSGPMVPPMGAPVVVAMIVSLIPTSKSPVVVLAVLAVTSLSL